MLAALTRHLRAVLFFTLLCRTMSLDEEEEEEWNQGVEEHGEFAYEDYVFPRRKMRREAEADAMVDILDDDAARADAFAGKHCPICLGKIDDSSSVIESCKHIYCTSCLFEVGEHVCVCLDSRNMKILRFGCGRTHAAFLERVAEVYGCVATICRDT